MDRTLPEAEARLDQSVFAELLASSTGGAARAAAQQEPQSMPQQIGDFRVLRQIGSGGMGVVYEAEQGKLGRRVALKVLSRSLSISEETLERFRREAEAGGRLSHSGIVSVYDFGETEEGPYIVQELIPGARDLSDLFEELRGLATVPRGFYEGVAELLVQIAEALGTAHELGIVHRDIKPANILLTDDGHPKVTDFGLAKMENAMTLSQSGSIIGTLFYLSPEQVRAQRHGVDARSDVFSLGVTMYEFLTLRRPFDGDNAEQVLDKILNMDPPSPLEFRSRMPEELALICLKSIEKRPEDRYASMADLAADLRRFMENRPILAQPPSTVRRTRKWMARNPALSMGLVMGSLALVVISMLLVFALRAREEAVANAAETSEARDRADQARRDTEVIVEFQGRMLTGIDELETGNVLLADLRGQLLDRAGEGSELLDGFDRAMRMVNAAEVARGVIDGTILGRASRAIDLEYADRPLIRARLATTIGRAYFKLGMLEPAAAHLNAAIDVHRAETGGASRLATCLEYLGATLREQSRYTESEAALREALALFEAMPDLPPARLAASQRMLGETLYRKGEFEEAERLMQLALEYGEDHPGEGAEQGDLQASLAELYRVQGQFELAKRYFNEAIASFEGLDGDEQKRIATCRSNLGVLLQEQGDFVASEKQHRLALASMRERLGNSHPELHMAMSNLGLALRGQLKLLEAAEVFRESLVLQREALGPEDPRLAKTMANLGVNLLDLRKLPEAEELLLGAVELVLMADPPVPSDVALFNMNLGIVVMERGRAEEAGYAFEEALSVARDLPEGHWILGSVLTAYGTCLTRQREYERAESVLQEAYPILLEAFGETNFRPRNTAQNLSILYTQWNAIAPDQGYAEQAALWTSRFQ